MKHSLRIFASTITVVAVTLALSAPTWADRATNEAEDARVKRGYEISLRHLS